MTDHATTDFFYGLADRGHEPLLEKVSSTIRIELTDDGRVEYWVVSIDKGVIGVERSNAPADCMLRTTSEVFARLATGEENTMAAVLRGAIAVDGDREQLALFQRLFPGPPVGSAMPVGATAGTETT
jgi:putative sterol carrier protein